MKMLKRVRRYTKDQRGYVLALSLVIMMFGTMVVGSLLTYAGAAVNTRATARDNLNSYYAADAGMQLLLAKLIQADYTVPDPFTGQPVPAPLPERYDFDDDGKVDDDEYYAPGQEDFFPNLLEDGEPRQINGYEVILTVKYPPHNVEFPDFVEYEVTSYVFVPLVPGTTLFEEAKEGVVATVRQMPYPLIGVMRYHAVVKSWQRGIDLIRDAEPWKPD